ncbi:MAG: class I SAM-dependent methyltransferase [Bryobacteraceae bacterium]
MRQDLLPWALEGLDLGANPLEIGPGPGLTTEVLRTRCTQLTCLEIDPDLAAALKARLGSQNVTVQHGDATAMPFPDNAFSGAASFTMLHHVPSPQLQDKLLQEACRVIRPGAWLVGSDSRTSLLFRLLHLGDTMVVSDPNAFPNRLRAAGFEEVAISLSPGSFAFRARKPAA